MPTFGAKPGFSRPSLNFWSRCWLIGRRWGKSRYSFSAGAGWSLSRQL